MLTDLRRVPRGKPSGYQGQASWGSSVINLVNTSESRYIPVLNKNE